MSWASRSSPAVQMTGVVWPYGPRQHIEGMVKVMRVSRSRQRQSGVSAAGGNRKSSQACGSAPARVQS